MAIRRFIVCFDGTWNTPGKGVGTGDALDRIAGGASGKGLTQGMVDGAAPWPSA